MFVKKLILALSLIPPFVFLWWLGSPSFSALMLMFAAIASFEVVSMGTGKERYIAAAAAVPGAVMIAAVHAFALPITLSQVLLIALLVAFTLHLFAPGDMASVGARTGVTTLAMLYGGLPISYLIMLRDVPDHGLALSFLALSISWFCDTFAYVGGRFLGKRKLYPKMSPNKTIEGLLVGMTAAGIAAAVTSHAFGLPWSPFLAAGLGFIGGAVGQVGDLAESMLKRSFGVKDSGAFLGPHGGVLDRFDAVLFVAPLVYGVWSFHSFIAPFLSPHLR